MTVHDTLLKAVEVIKERGWTQGDLIDDAGRVCLNGSIFVALEGNPDTRYDTFNMDAFREAVDAVQDVLPPKSGYTTVWNDKPGRTADEVIDLLTAAAEAQAVPA